MNSVIDELSQAVLRRPLQECSIDELQQITTEFPYFGPAHLLLAKKLSTDLPANSSNVKDQVQKTSLYFPNRVWLDHLLNGYETATATTFETQPGEPEIAATTTDHESFAPPIESPIITEIITDLPETKTTDELDNNGENLATSETAVAAEQSVELSEPPSVDRGHSPASQVEASESANVNTDADPLFEPYHTVDYFASQGIKFREEEKPKDRLGQQLKSFTEWLKTLKRVSATEIVAPTDPNADKNIEQMAEYSIAERHVITEAMAEVWMKQGNRVKAEEIYRKLSLLDPSKSSYFAAKIEELKKTS